MSVSSASALVGIPSQGGTYANGEVAHRAPRVGRDVLCTGRRERIRKRLHHGPWGQAVSEAMAAKHKLPRSDPRSEPPNAKSPARRPRKWQRLTRGHPQFKPEEVERSLARRARRSCAAFRGDGLRAPLRPRRRGPPAPARPAPRARQQHRSKQPRLRARHPPQRRPDRRGAGNR